MAPVTLGEGLAAAFFFLIFFFFLGDEAAGGIVDVRAMADGGMATANAHRGVRPVRCRGRGSAPFRVRAKLKFFF